jgi:hypothetical protein
MSYKLTLTEDDWKTIQFVGHRYCWSTALLAALFEDRSREVSGTTYDIPEHVMWEIYAAFDADTEGGHDFFPMLASGSELCSKLAVLYMSVV